MRFTKMLRRRSEEPRIPLITRDFYARVASYIDTLESALNRLRRDHTHCDDSWYCCGACRHPDHVLAEDEHLAGHDGESPRTSGVCNCGADAHNNLIDNVLADGEMDSQKVRGATNKNVPEEKMTR